MKYPKNKEKKSPSSAFINTFILPILLGMAVHAQANKNNDIDNEYIPPTYKEIHDFLYKEKYLMQQNLEELNALQKMFHLENNETYNKNIQLIFSIGIEYVLSYISNEKNNFQYHKEAKECIKKYEKELELNFLYWHRAYVLKGITMYTNGEKSYSIEDFVAIAKKAIGETALSTEEQHLVQTMPALISPNDFSKEQFKLFSIFITHIVTKKIKEEYNIDISNSLHDPLQFQFKIEQSLLISSSYTYLSTFYSTYWEKVIQLLKDGKNQWDERNNLNR
ncbi:MAG: hypothetical protein QM526_00240 [Alphaproteobacteria bacterium]|nr:hypothetical protein [Alphaproteobacteria bacterium]